MRETPGPIRCISRDYSGIGNSRNSALVQQCTRGHYSITALQHYTQVIGLYRQPTQGTNQTSQSTSFIIAHTAHTSTRSVQAPSRLVITCPYTRTPRPNLWADPSEQFMTRILESLDSISQRFRSLRETLLIKKAITREIAPFILSKKPRKR